MQIKTTLGYHFSPTNVAIIREWNPTPVSEDAVKLEPLCIASRNVNGMAIVENGLMGPQKLNIELT